MSRVVAGKLVADRFTILLPGTREAAPAASIVIVESIVTLTSGPASSPVVETLPSTEGLLNDGTAVVNADLPIDSVGKTLHIELRVTVDGQPSEMSHNLGVVTEDVGASLEEIKDKLEEVCDTLQDVLPDVPAPSNSNCRPCNFLRLNRNTDYTDENYSYISFALPSNLSVSSATQLTKGVLTVSKRLTGAEVLTVDMDSPVDYDKGIANLSLTAVKIHSIATNGLGNIYLFDYHLTGDDPGSPKLKVAGGRLEIV